MDSIKIYSQLKELTRQKHSSADFILWQYCLFNTKQRNLLNPSIRRLFVGVHNELFAYR